MFNLNNADMENLFTQINKERLVDSNTALMMKELYYYALCEYWYDKLDRLHTDTKERNTPMYMCECPTLAACIQWMIQTREYTFQTEQNGMVWHVVVKAGDYVLYDSESNADSFVVWKKHWKSSTGMHGAFFEKFKSPSGDFLILAKRGIYVFYSLLLSDFSAMPFLRSKRYTVPLLPIFNIFCISLTGVPDS